MTKTDPKPTSEPVEEFVPADDTIIGSDAARKMMHRPQREPWTI